MSKAALIGLFLAFAMSATGVASAQQYNSIRSANFPEAFIRHRNFLIYVERITESQYEEAVFQIVPGLSDSTCVSFHAKNRPGLYMRHQNFRLKLQQFIDEDLFRADATFCRREGLANRHLVSYESVNYPGYYWRHQDFELHLQKDDGSRLFKQDATFEVQGAIQPFEGPN